jgi:type I restriction enzyme S subunit
MRNGWQEKFVGDILQLEYGKPLDESDRKPNGRFPVYGANGEKDRTDRFYHEKPSIIVGRKGSAGEINLTETKFWPLDVTYFVTFDEYQHDLRFLFYLLTKLELTKLAKGVKPGINRNEVYSQVTRVPPLPEQQRIVGILDEAFEGITTAEANAEKNLQNSRAIFDSHLQAVFTQRGKGWVKATIGDVCMLKSGTTVPVAIERPNGDMPYVKVAEMTMPANSEGVTTSIRFLNQSDIKPVWIIPAGAVIFPKRGGAILTNKKRLALVDMCADLNIMSVIPTDKLTPEFLYMYFLTVDMRTLGTGSSIPQINNYDIAPLPISFPELKEKQIEVTEALQTIRTECKALAATYEQKLGALHALKKSLLHQAFSGNL